MKRVATAAVLIPLVLLAVYKAPFWALTWLIGVVALLATHEYLNIVKGYGVIPVRSGPYAAIATLFLITPAIAKYRSESILVLAFSLGILITSCVAMRRTDLREATLASALSLFALPYVGLALWSMTWFGLSLHCGYLFLFVFLAVWVGDTAAYYVGRSIGRHKLAPTVSPNKTWEGAIASALFSAVAVGLWARYGVSDQWLKFTYTIDAVNEFADAVSALHHSTILAAALGLLINIAAQLGDLFESMIKRGAGVKDSGTMLPGHGGILDRIDALLFAAPVALLLFTVLDRVLAP